MSGTALVGVEITSAVLPPVSFSTDAMFADSSGSSSGALGYLLRFIRPRFTITTPLGDTTSAPYGEPPATWSPLPLVLLALVFVAGVVALVFELLRLLRGSRRAK